MTDPLQDSDGFCDECQLYDGAHLSDCSARRDQVEPGSPHERRLTELAEWMRQDPDVAIIVRSTMARRGVGRMADLGPRVLKNLHEVVEGFLEESPTVKDPGFITGGP